MCIQISDVDNHADYDYVDYSNEDSKGKGLSTLETIQNPYYGGEVDTNESESIITSKAMRNSLRENIKVTNNIYYDQ